MGARDDRRGALAPTLGLLLLLTTPAAGAAQIADYRTLFIGEQAQGLGTAYTAVADSPTAAFHNPAGLAPVESTSLSSSLTLLNVDVVEIRDGFGGPAGVEDLDSRTGLNFPFSIGFNAKFGRRMSDGIQRNSLAFTTFSPLRLGYSFDHTQIGNGTTDQLRITRNDTSTWYGLSFARRLSKDRSFGVSLFFANRRLRHNESQTIFAEGPLEVLDGGYPLSTLETRDNATRIDARYLVARFGGLFELTPRLRVGVMGQLPGLSVGSEGRVQELTAESDLTADPALGRVFQERIGNLDASLPIPFEVRVGLRWSMANDAFLTADAGMVGWQNDVRPLSIPEPESGERTAGEGFFFPERFTMRARGNLALGVSGTISPRVPVRGGLFFESPATGRRGRTGDSYRPMRFFMLGGALGIGFRNEVIDLDVGAVAQLGLGEAYGLDPNRPDPGAAGYVRRRARRLGFLLFIGGYKSTAERLAQETYERSGLRKVLDGDEEDDGGDEGGSEDDGGGSPDTPP